MCSAPETHIPDYRNAPYATCGRCVVAIRRADSVVAIRFFAPQEALHAADWLRADAFSSSSPEARGGLGEEDFYWALSVSRLQQPFHCRVAR